MSTELGSDNKDDVALQIIKEDVQHGYHRALELVGESKATTILKQFITDNAVSYGRKLSETEMKELIALRSQCEKF